MFKIRPSHILKPFVIILWPSCFGFAHRWLRKEVNSGRTQATCNIHPDKYAASFCCCMIIFLLHVCQICQLWRWGITLSLHDLSTPFDRLNLGSKLLTGSFCSALFFISTTDREEASFVISSLQFHFQGCTSVASSVAITVVRASNSTLLSHLWHCNSGGIT